MGLTRPKYTQMVDTDYKQSVRLATTTDIGNLLATSSITNTIDGNVVVDGDRILVKNQNTSAQNGIYIVSSAGTDTNGTWIRSTDANSNVSVTFGLTTTVSSGTTNAGTTWKLSTPDPIELGTTGLTFVNASQSGGSSGTVTAVAALTLGTTGTDVSSTVATSTSTPVITLNLPTASATNRGVLNSTDWTIFNGKYSVGDALGTPASGNFSTGTFTWPTFNQNTTGTAAGLSATLAIENGGTGVNAAGTSGNVLTSNGTTWVSQSISIDAGLPTTITGLIKGNGSVLSVATSGVDFLPVTSPAISTSITTASTTFNLINTTATNVNFAGDANAISVGAVTGTTTINHDLQVAGNIYFNGTSNRLSGTNLDVTDSLIYLSINNVADTFDIGWVGGYQPSTTHLHTGLVRDATDGIWKLFSNISAEPTTTVNFTGVTYDTLQVGTLLANTITGNLSGCTFPTLNQNTSGTAAGLSATLAVASGGTGATSAPNALTALGAQAVLVSGTSIKTVNGNSLLGSGDVATATTGKAIAMAIIFGG